MGDKGLLSLIVAVLCDLMQRTASLRRSGTRLHTNQLGPADIIRHKGLSVTAVPHPIADVGLARQHGS